MASPASLPSLLTTLTSALKFTAASLPDVSSVIPPSDGLSLLDTKNELLLSYLQNLVFLILLKIRSYRQRLTLNQDDKTRTSAEEEEEDKSLRNDVTQKLVELRVYLEKGVRPLEGKLRYQIDKLVSAANEADAVTKATTEKKAPSHQAPKHGSRREDDGDVDDEEDDHDDNDDNDENKHGALATISDLSYRPNPSAFAPSPTPTHGAPRDLPTPPTGPYRPPRITPTALPTTTTTTAATSASQKASRQRTSHTLNEYIREEMDDAPLAEPSIGAGSGLQGREREREEERRRYEEMRLVRLPEERKGKRRGRGGVGDDGRAELEGGFGGVDGVDFGRMDDGSGRGGKRRKREGGKGSAAGGGGGRIGEAWGKRVKRGVGRKGKG